MSSVKAFLKGAMADPSAEDADCPRQGDLSETNELPQKKRKLREQKSVLSDAVAAFRDGRQPETDADSIYSGTLLEELADENAKTFAIAAPSRPLAGPCALRWGSCCSGQKAAISYSKPSIGSCFGMAQIVASARHLLVRRLWKKESSSGK